MKYIKRNRDRLMVHNHLILDMKALSTPCNLDCFRCHDAHEESCCQNGQPYAVIPDQMPLIERHARSIAKDHLSHNAQKLLHEEGLWDTSPLKEPGTVTSVCGSCFFSTDIQGKRCCALHAYAIANKLDVFPMKPFSCQLYPLDIIEVGSMLLVTALTEETAVFSRWGQQYLDSFYCANQKRREQATHLPQELFDLTEYQPAYRIGRYLIEQAFGQGVYLVIEASLQCEV